MRRFWFSILFGILCAGPALGQVKISNLPSASTPLSGTELVPMVQGGITKSASAANVANALTTLTGPVTATGQTVTGGTFSGSTLSGGTLSGTTTNSGTLSGGILSGPTLSGTLSGGTLQPSTALGIGYGGTAATTQAGAQSSLGLAPLLASASNVKATLANVGTTLTVTADEVAVETALGGTPWKLASYSQALNIATTGAGGMDAGTAPANGFVAIYAIYNPMSPATSILATNAATSSGAVYSGSNMPSGYTMSALLAIWPTNGSSQLAAGSSLGRWFQYPNAIGVLSSGTATSATPVSLSSLIPLVSVEARMFITTAQPSGSIGANSACDFGPTTTTGIFVQPAEVIGVNNTGALIADLPTAQTYYYKAQQAGMQCSLFLSAYSIPGVSQ